MKAQEKNTIEDIFSKIDGKKTKERQFGVSKNLGSGLPVRLTTNTLYKKTLEKTESNLNQAFGSHIIRKILNDNELFNDKLESGNFLLEKFQKRLKLKAAKNEVSDKLFGKKLEKQLKYFRIPQNYAKYSLYLPMHSIWKQYTASLLENEKNGDAFFLKLLKADFNGAIIKVLSAKNRCYEGQSGIVIQETMRTFRIVTKSDKILTILKQNVIFLMEVAGKTVKLFGQHLCYRPSDRLKIKFKMKECSKFTLNHVQEDIEDNEEESSKSKNP